jgi:hypothetical protein
MTNDNNQPQNVIDNCLKHISLIESHFRYCSNGEQLGKALGVYEGAARQIVDLTGKLEAQLSHLKRIIS